MARTGLTAADATRAYVDDHPSIREVLREDLLNYTALARKLRGELDLKNEEAVTIACRRYQRELAGERPELAAVRRLLSESRLQVHSGVALVRVRDEFEVAPRLLDLAQRTLPSLGRSQVFQVYQGTRATTILCQESFLSTLLPEIPVRLRMGVEKGLAILAFRSGPAVAETPGVLAYMAEALYQRGINCLETVSVHTDSMFLFRDQDVIRAYQVLSGLVPPRAPKSRAIDAGVSRPTLPTRE
jgi:hypothetical protein